MTTSVHENPVQFQELLHRLKRDGCNLLLVGEMTPDRWREAGRRFFGVPSERRYRLLVSTGGVGHALSVREADERTRLVELSTVSRGSPGDDGEGTFEDAEPFLREELAALEPDSGFDPGECRIGIHTLAPFVGGDRLDGTIRSLERVTEAVRDRRGMAHYVLPTGYGNGPEPRLRPLFDAVIEYRCCEDCVEQRWHAPEESLTTDWVPLSETR